MHFITLPTCANVSVCGVIVCEQSISLAPFASAAAATVADMKLILYLKGKVYKGVVVGT